MSKTADRPKKLADEHWEFIEGFIDVLPGERMAGLALLEYVYKQAMIHGYNHGVEDAADFKLTLPD